MSSEVTVAQTFEEFVRRAESSLHDALSALYGTDRGRDAVAEALAYGWEHWDRIRAMDNPIGYLYVVGRDRGRPGRGVGRPVLMPIDSARTPWVEPGLPEALGLLSGKQRSVVMLLHCYDWTMAEVAEVLGVSKSTVQGYDRRAMRRLRRKLGVPE